MTPPLPTQAPRLPSLLLFPWTDWAGAAGDPFGARAQCMVWGLGQARARGLWRRRLSVCSCVLAILPRQPSTIGNHGEADAALLRGWARQGRGQGPPGMPTAIHHRVPRPLTSPLLPDRHPLTQSEFNKFMWVFNLNSTTPPCAFLPLSPQRAGMGGSPRSGKETCRLKDSLKWGQWPPGPGPSHPSLPLPVL